MVSLALLACFVIFSSLQLVFRIVQKRVKKFFRAKDRSEKVRRLRQRLSRRKERRQTVAKLLETLEERWVTLGIRLRKELTDAKNGLLAYHINSEELMKRASVTRGRDFSHITKMCDKVEERLLSYTKLKKKERCTCVACYDEKRCMAYIPCGHLTFCERCVEKAQKKTCAVCSLPSQGIFKIYE